MMSMMTRGLVPALLLAAWPAMAGSQSVATRTPNLLGGWAAPRGVVQLNFLHRFTVSDAPLRKVTNTPTFNVGTGVSEDVMVGFVYGSNSALVPAYPNEWELYARAVALEEAEGAPLDLSVQGGYNVASESVDGEVAVARGLGRLRLLLAARAFSRAYDSGRTRYAVHGGASLNLTPSVSVAGDYGVLTDRAGDEPAAWGAGIQMGVPLTPHSFSVHVSNVGTASLEGASRGTERRFGFEYTVPINVRRYVPRGDDRSERATGTPPPPMAVGAAMEAGADTVVIEIRNIAYATTEVELRPGTTVRWINRDPIQHSVTSEEASFDSGLLDPGASFSVTFSEAGTYPFHCVPHPFMQGRVIVRGMTPREGAR